MFGAVWYVMARSDAAGRGGERFGYVRVLPSTFLNVGVGGLVSGKVGNGESRLGGVRRGVDRNGTVWFSIGKANRFAGVFGAGLGVAGWGEVCRGKVSKGLAWFSVEWVNKSLGVFGVWLGMVAYGMVVCGLARFGSVYLSSV